MQWFRFYNNAPSNTKLKLLAFEDRWHYVAVLCMKSQGLLDTTDDDLRERRIAAELGLTLRESEEVKRRLSEVDLVDESWHPVAWNERQFRSDNSSNRVRKYRENKKKQECNDDETLQKRSRNVTETASDTDTDTEKHSAEPKKRFAPPSLEAVQARVQEMGYSVSAESFWNFYESNGWKVGKNKMRCWKRALAGWQARQQPTGEVVRYQ